MINPSMPRKAPIVEESFNSVNVSRREDIKNLTINISKGFNANDIIRALDKYRGYFVTICNISSIDDINALCNLFGNYKYDGYVTIDLLYPDKDKSIEGLSNGKIIVIEKLPDNVKLKGFLRNNAQNEFSSWAHNLCYSHKKELQNHLCPDDNKLFIEQNNVLIDIHMKLLMKYPNIMSMSVYDRFLAIYRFIELNYPYAFECLNEKGDNTRNDSDWAKDPIETYKRGRGVCGGRSGLLTLAANNSLYRVNCTSVNGVLPGGVEHCWNIFIDPDGDASYYDLSFSNMNGKNIKDTNGRTITRINSCAKEIMNRPELPKRNNKKLTINPKIPPRW